MRIRLKIINDTTQLAEGEAYDEIKYLLENEEAREEAIGKKFKVKSFVSFNLCVEAAKEMGEAYNMAVLVDNDKNLYFIYFSYQGKEVFTFDELEKEFGFEKFYNPMTAIVEETLAYRPLKYQTKPVFFLEDATMKIVD